MKQHMKRIVAALCFILLLYIDKVVGTESQYIWLITNNLVGVVFAIIIMSAFSYKDFLKPFYIIWSIIGVAGIVGGYEFWYAHQVNHIFAYWVTVPLNVWFLGMVVAKYVEKIFIDKSLQVKFEKWEAVFAICSILMLLSRSDDVWPVYYLILFLMFWHAPFSDDDKKLVFSGMLDGIIIGFLILQSYAFVVTKYITPRYRGAYGDCNRNACMYLIVLSAVLVRLVTSNSKSKKVVLYGLLASSIMALSLYTGCRSAFIGIIFIVGLYALIGEKLYNKIKWSRLLVRLFGLFATTLVLVPVMYFPIRYFPDYSRRIYADIGSIRTGSNGASHYTDEYVSFEDAFGSTLLRFFTKDVENESADEGTSMMVASEDIDSLVINQNPGRYTIKYTFINYPERGELEFTAPKYLYSRLQSFNHRINIYLVLLHNMNLFGHSGDELFVNITSDVPGADYVPLRNEQNFVLHYLYSYGVPIGLMVCIMLLAEMAYFIKQVKARRVDGLAFLMFMTAYICMGLMEVVWIPGQIVLVLLFVAPFFRGDILGVDNCERT